MEAKNKREHKGKSLLIFADEYVSLDIETSGLSTNNCEIIEIGAVKVKNNEICEEFSELIKPQNEIDYYITNLTGITNEMLCDKRSIKEVISDFSDFLGDSFIVGQNVNFDINFLYDNMEKNIGKYLTNNFADTLRLSTSLFPNFPDHKLSTLKRMFSIENDVRHRGLSDSIDAMKCYEYMRNYANDMGLLDVNEIGKEIDKKKLKKYKSDLKGIAD